MKFKGLLPTTVAILLLSLSFAGCKSAVSAIQQKAEQGDAGAQYDLGRVYANGKDVPQDYNQAVKWFRLAADQGNAKAQDTMGLCYFKGAGVPQDYKEAARWFRLAADRGDVGAQYTMGRLCYAGGAGVPQDYVQAYAWYNLAAAQGNKDAAASRTKLMEKMTPTQIEEGQRLSREYAEKFIKK